jgi:hypothetical protein
MEIRIPSQIVIYTLGCLAVILVVGAISWAVVSVERYITRKRLEQATKDDN